MSSSRPNPRMNPNPNQPPRPAANHLSRKLLALDHGERRVGCRGERAGLGMLAHPRSAITHTSTAAVLEAVAELVRDEEVAEVIVGLPLPLSGEAGRQAREARELHRVLRAALCPCPSSKLTTSACPGQGRRRCARRPRTQALRPA
ncbi:MAG: Holliday junction resolvase RuvX [Dehalococcoidia bacterium]|nr:Holliday junction resolvase RuvX [Dehalococcoidia bacterium]